MPTRIIILFSATVGIVLFIIVGIIITVLVTGKVMADKSEKENKRRWFLKSKKDKKEEVD